jgi:hypothetical protein
MTKDQTDSRAIAEGVTPCEVCAARQAAEREEEAKASERALDLKTREEILSDPDACERAPTSKSTLRTSLKRSSF